MGVYNEWVEKSLQKLAEFIPARYDKPEETSGIVGSLDTYIYEIVRPEPPAPIEPQAEIPLQTEQTETAIEIEDAAMEELQATGPVTESDPETSAVAEETGIVTESGDEEIEEIEATDSVTEPDEPPVETQLPDSATKNEAVEMEQDEDSSPVSKALPDAAEQLGEEAQMGQTTGR